MTITKEKAIQKAVNLLSSRIKSRLKIAGYIDGHHYNANKINFSNSWIIYVEPEEQIYRKSENIWPMY